ncbi:lipopolysaccharide biosynthesis protein [Phenylobacterium sp.]|jgi:O-antigen/teichoic acid export membrane protein|uniref:polysaccharide biosynthesis protein HfsF n=1 Tax=Phenylobacterium sp. TaxID=1871053 RepID=UPI000C935440|nr:lipopolysaccharide biosynthesis protein [Phenylobacterium sp.]MAK81119.1 polysaccharide biosynthesis protein [Phenylobacterium sp.]|tara:strand:- start:4160 stop:5602 length:1443 start_codon:yes stop_codon:yes gene_type:complete
MFWRGVVGYLPVNIIQGLVGLATIVTFTRLLSPGQFGDYALGFSAMSLLHTAIFTWNEAAMARFWVGEADKGRGGDHSATIYRTWLALLVVLPVALAIALLLPLSPGLKLAVVCGVLAVLPRTFAKLAQERRRAAGEVAGAASIDMIQTLGAFGVGAIFAWQGFGGAAPLIGFGVAAAVCMAWTLPSELRHSRQGRFESPRVRTYLGYGLPVAMSLILALVLSTTDRFLLAAFLDEASVGLYHAGYSLANRTLDVLFIWLGAAGGPALIAALERGGPGELGRAAREQASLMLLLCVPAAVGLALVAAPLAQLMVGPELAEGAAHVTPWIALSGLLAGLTTYYFHQAFTLGQRTQLLLGAMAIPAIVNLVLNLILIPRFGLDGALWATLASYALGLAASMALGARSLVLPIPWLALVQTLGATAVMALAVSRVPALGGWAELLLKAGLGGLVFGAITFVLDTGALRSRGLTLLRDLRARPA